MSKTYKNMSEDFRLWLSDQSSIGSAAALVARRAWDHQQAKIDIEHRQVVGLMKVVAESTDKMEYLSKQLETAQREWDIKR